MRDHDNWVIKGGATGFGYTAQRRGTSGKGVGHTYKDLTLDGLAGQLREAGQDHGGSPALLRRNGASAQPR